MIPNWYKLIYNLKFPGFAWILVFYATGIGQAQNTQQNVWTNKSKDKDWLKNDQFTPRGTPIGKVLTLPEASGIAPSFANPGMIWAHNDSGQKPFISLIDVKDGSIYSMLQLPSGSNVDWEDMECINDKENNRSRIYLADIGDNLATRSHVTIYIVLDEKMPFQKILDANVLDKIRFTYPEGPRDAESLLVDPLTRDIYIVSKREKFVNLYLLTFPYTTEKIDTAKLLGTFPFNQITGGSISPDGTEILIRSYGRIFYWKRKGNETISQTLMRNPELAPYSPIEPQGEAICWHFNGRGYYTLSEKRRRQMPEPTLYYYKRLPQD